MDISDVEYAKYKQILSDSEVIKQQSVVLGPGIVVMKVRSVKGLTINDVGEMIAV